MITRIWASYNQRLTLVSSLAVAMASEHSSSGPVLHEMTPVSISSGLVPNPPSSTPFVPPSRYGWDLLFQPMFDESLKHQKSLLRFLKQLHLNMLYQLAHFPQL
ncbi:hypothetical protein Tco_0108021 [Tanacetum coccineum]